MRACAQARRFSRDRRGAAAAEFAIVAPLLFVFLGGILVYGLYFATIHSLQQLVAEAGRASIAGLDDAERETLARAQIDGTIASYALLRREHMQVRAATDPGAADRYTVSIVYDATHLGLNAFGALLPQPPNHIARNAVIRKGGV
jgi:Flp pilus assembly protein TadG